MEAHVRAAQQYFPTYKLDLARSEIGLREYDLAAKALEADQKSLTAAAGIALFVGGTLATLLGSSTSASFLDKLAHSSGSSDSEVYVVAIAPTLSLFAIRYFALLQKSAVHAARKIVVLRRLMGLDYGNIETVLPAGTIDGANEPFAIQMFPGWRSLQAIPAIATAAIAGFAQWVLINAADIQVPSALILDWSFLPSSNSFSATISVLTFTLLLFIYRLSLRDTFESLRFLVSKNIAAVIGMKLKDRTGHVIYRIKLAIFEAHRLKVDLKQMHRTLIFIEDRGYHRHNGNSMRAAVSALWRYYKYGFRSGGSTIAQQMVRSNFLKNLHPPFRRKLIEWMLAPWVTSQFKSAEGLDAYLVSVRYAYRVTGIVEALRHFFPGHDISEPLSPAMKFVLVERLSNISATYPASRIQRIARDAKSHRLLDTGDIAELNYWYDYLGQLGVIDTRGQVISII